MTDLFQSLLILALCIAVYRLEGLRRKDKRERAAARIARSGGSDE